MKEGGKKHKRKNIEPFFGKVNEGDTKKHISAKLKGKN